MLALCIARWQAEYKISTINLNEFKPALLTSLRSMACKDWDSAHEIAWTWLWENIERLLKTSLDKSPVRQGALERLFGQLQDKDRQWANREVYVKFFALVPAGKDHFKQSETRLHQLSDRVFDMTLQMYTDPKVTVDRLSIVGRLHVGFGIPTDLFGPYVAAWTQVMQELTDDEAAHESFRWVLSLMSRIMVRVMIENANNPLEKEPKPTEPTEQTEKQPLCQLGCAPS